MNLTFTKMQGAGNDFIVLNGMRGIDPSLLSPASIQRLADRKFGIGADQVLVVEPPSDRGCDFDYRIFNADGNEVEQCGNGARCFARFVIEQGLATGPTIRVKTKSGIISPTVLPNGDVLVDMGRPDLSAKSLPFLIDGLAIQSCGKHTCYGLHDHEGMACWFGPVSMGNPHLVQWVKELEHQPVAERGQFLQVHPRLPKSVNVGFAEIVDAEHIRLRVFERGAGETLACGTGACAAVVAGVAQGRLTAGKPIEVQTRGGQLSVTWSGLLKDSVWMAGPAKTVFHGQIEV